MSNPPYIYAEPALRRTIMYYVCVYIYIIIIIIIRASIFVHTSGGLSQSVEGSTAFETAAWEPCCGTTPTQHTQHTVATRGCAAAETRRFSQLPWGSARGSAQGSAQAARFRRPAPWLMPWQGLSQRVLQLSQSKFPTSQHHSTSFNVYPMNPHETLESSKGTCRNLSACVSANFCISLRQCSELRCFGCSL